MFRVTTCISSVRSILTRRHPIDYHIASIKRCPPNNAIYNPRQREECPPPPPPPPKPPKDDSWLWGTVTVLLLTGVGIVAAKHNPEIRDWLTLYAPWADDIVAILYEENMTHKEFACECIEKFKKYIASFSEEEKVPKPCALDGKKKPAPVEAPAPPQSEEDEEEVEEIDEGLTCDPEPPPVVTQGICDIERCLKELGEFVNNNYWTAKQACAHYNLIVDETMDDFSFNNMKKLHFAKQERLDLVKVSLRNACNAIRRIEEMVRYIDCGVQASKDEIDSAKLLYKNNKIMYAATRMEYQWENDKAKEKDRQWNIVESLVDKYTSENVSMYPGLKYTEDKPAIGGDPDILLYCTLRYAKQLDEDLKAACQGMSERVNRAYDGLPKGAQIESARNAAVKAAVAKRSADFTKYLKDLSDRQKDRNDKLLKRLTLEQTKKHEANLAKKLAEKEKEVTAKFNKMVEEKVTAQKRIFAGQLQDMAMKLQVVEDKLNARLKVERETRRSQELWAAGASLLAATKKGGPYINVNKELNAIEKASDGEDQLVLTVLKAIPPSVREVGLVPETVLKEKYRVMESTALKVSLVEEDGATMPVYILSWVQALLLFMKISGIPQDEFEKPPMEPPRELDTFDLLQRARFWVERGNLAVALRYVNHLQGASRLAAHQWYESARAHLEVRQAAEAVLAHAAAMGLQYI